MGARSKIKRLLALIPSLISRMPKRPKKNITRHTVDLGSSDDHSSEDEDPTPRTEPHRHVAYSVAGDNISRRTTYVPLPTRDKRPRLSPLPTDGFATPAEDRDVDALEELDLNYLYNRIENLSMDPAARNRTAGVCAIGYWMRRRSDLLDRTTPF